MKLSSISRPNAYHCAVTKKLASMMGNGRHSVLRVKITCRSLMSGDAKKKTPTEQQSRPKIVINHPSDKKKRCLIKRELVCAPISFEALMSSVSILLYTIEKVIIVRTSRIWCKNLFLLTVNKQ
jgi:hypothetical protein